ncbi:MAG: malonyl-CoA decarboxylase, partial [Polaromonas sp.]|nr:malonyl-CoA decarboxylase [Polaromonas sp.]
MITPDWISRSVSILRSSEKAESKRVPAHAERAQVATKSGASTGAVRSTRERLAATLRQKEEALSPRVLRR